MNNERHAHSCDMTLITGSHAGLHLDGIAERMMRQAAGHRGRYDLLALPSLEDAIEQAEHVELLQKDLRAAIGLHGVERAFILTEDMLPRTATARLESGDYGKRLRFAGAKTETILPIPTDQETLVITCMDWRLHGPVGGLTTALKTTVGVERYGLMSFAGAAKEVASGERRNFLMDQLEHAVRGGLKRILFLAHTDCGKYGGRSAFPDIQTECGTMGADIKRATEAVHGEYPALRIDAGVIRTGTDRAEGIEWLWHEEPRLRGNYSGPR